MNNDEHETVEHGLFIGFSPFQPLSLAWVTLGTLGSAPRRSGVRTSGLAAVALCHSWWRRVLPGGDVGVRHDQ